MLGTGMETEWGSRVSWGEGAVVKDDHETLKAKQFLRTKNIRIE